MTDEIKNLRALYRAANQAYQEAWPRVVKAQAAVAKTQEPCLALAVQMYQSEEEFCDAFDAAREAYARAALNLAHCEREAARLLGERDAIFRDLAAAEKAA